MRVLVTGGAGFIGSHVADGLLAAGHTVAILDDLSTGNRRNLPSNATFFEGDIRDAAQVEAIFGEFTPELVTHQAAQTSVSVSTREPIRDAEINVQGTIHVLQACIEHDVQRFVFASTGGAIYGEVPGNERAAVGRQTMPISPYACSKLAGEAYIACWHAEHGLPYTILRYANVYGPRQDPHGEAGVVAIFTRRLLAKDGIQINAMREPGDPGCIRDYVYVSDVVDANVHALAGKIEPPIVNVATGQPSTTLDIANLIEKAVGSPAEVRVGPKRAGDLQRSVLEPGAFGVERPRDLRSGIDATVAWFRENE